MNQPEQESLSDLTIPIFYAGGEDEPILFVDQLLMKIVPGGFHISFAQTHGPYTTTISSKEQEILKRDGVPAKIVANMFVPFDRMQKFVAIFADQVEKYPGIAKELDQDDNG